MKMRFNDGASVFQGFLSRRSTIWFYWRPKSDPCSETLCNSALLGKLRSSPSSSTSSYRTCRHQRGQSFQSDRRGLFIVKLRQLILPISWPGGHRLPPRVDSESPGDSSEKEVKKKPAMKRPAVKQPSPDHSPLSAGGKSDEDSGEDETGGAGEKTGRARNSSNAKKPKNKAKPKAKNKTPMKRRRQETRFCCCN